MNLYKLVVFTSMGSKMVCIENKELGVAFIKFYGNYSYLKDVLFVLIFYLRRIPALFSSSVSSSDDGCGVRSKISNVLENP